MASRRATGDEWDAAWAGCTHATFFESRAWAECWERASARAIRPAPTVVEFDSGRTAVLPCSTTTSFRFVTRALCAPAGTYGGWLTDRDLDADEVRSIREWLLGAHGAIEWRANPYAVGVDAVADETEVFRADTTHAVDLRGAFEDVVRRWSRSHREAVRKAARRGVTVRVAESAGDWARYDQVYRATLERWGGSASSNHPAALFDALREREDERVTLWLAERDGEVVAGVLCCSAHDHVSYWHGASLEEHLDAKPMQLLLHDAMRDASERGIRWFDLNPSGGHEGTRTFKERFGAVELPAPVVDRRVSFETTLSRLASLMGFGG